MVSCLTLCISHKSLLILPVLSVDFLWFLFLVEPYDSALSKSWCSEVSVSPVWLNIILSHKIKFYDITTNVNWEGTARERKHFVSFLVCTKHRCRRCCALFYCFMLEIGHLTESPVVNDLLCNYASSHRVNFHPYQMPLLKVPLMLENST